MNAGDTRSAPPSTAGIDDLRSISLPANQRLQNSRKPFTPPRKPALALRLRGSRKPSRGAAGRVQLAEFLWIDPELELEGCSVPHFYSAFYVYKNTLPDSPQRWRWPARSLRVAVLRNT